MSDSDDKNRAAFPRPWSHGPPIGNEREWYTATRGITVREYFACAMMQGLVANGDIPPDKNLVAECAVEYADALIRALKT